MTTSDYLTQLQQDREDLVDNLTTQGITGLTGDETFTELVPEVLNISTGGSSYPPDWSLLDYSQTPKSIIDGYDYAINIKNSWDSTQTNLSSKYYQNYVIEFFPLVNTSNATNITSMFSNCTKLSYIPALTFNTSSFSELFYNCYALGSVDTSNWNTTQTTSFYRMFANCRGLTEIDMSTIEAPNLTDIRQMFDGCSNLKKLDIRKLEFTNVGSSYTTNIFRSVPADCLIIVKDSTVKTFILGIRSDFTNVQTVAEYEG